MMIGWVWVFREVRVQVRRKVKKSEWYMVQRARIRAARVEKNNAMRQSDGKITNMSIPKVQEYDGLMREN